MKRWAILIVAVVLLVLVLAGFKGFGLFRMFQSFKAQGAPQFTVSTVKADYADWQPQFEAVGSLRAVRGADLSAEVAGIVDQVKFKSGENVPAGRVLLTLRDQDDRAHLEALKATAKLAAITYKRDQQQLEATAISQAVVDTDKGNLDSADAQVTEEQALVAKKTVRAPFAGQLGIRAVDEGQYLAPGTKIVTLQALDPMYVDFTVPQDVLAQVVIGQKVAVTIDAFPGQSFEGVLAAVDPSIDAATRNIALRASLPNHDHRLLPGLFAKVKLDVSSVGRNLVLPQTALTYNPYGTTVYVVEHNDKVPAGADGVAQQRVVQVGATRGDQVAILDGVKAGEEVVVAGQMKLRNGAPVKVNNQSLPASGASVPPLDAPAAADGKAAPTSAASAQTP